MLFVINYAHLDKDFGWLDGWNAAIAGNLNQLFGIKAELSGLYGKNAFYEDIKYRGYSFMAGPQISGRSDSFTAFGHILLGIEHLSESMSIGDYQVSDSINAFSMAIGGGLDWHGQRRVGWRMFQVDYLPWRADGETAHNFRVSTGVVFRF